MLWWSLFRKYFLCYVYYFLPCNLPCCLQIYSLDHQSEVLNLKFTQTESNFKYRSRNIILWQWKVSAWNSHSGMIFAKHKLWENIFESSKNVSETTSCPLKPGWPISVETVFAVDRVTGPSHPWKSCGLWVVSGPYQWWLDYRRIYASLGLNELIQGYYIIHKVPSVVHAIGFSPEVYLIYSSKLKQAKTMLSIYTPNCFACIQLDLCDLIS